MTDFIFVKGADRLLQVQHPIDEANQDVITGGGTVVTAQLFDVSFDGPIRMRKEFLTEDYETNGALIANVTETSGFTVADLVELEDDAGGWIPDVIASIDGTANTLTLTNTAGASVSAGRTLRAYQQVIGSVAIEVNLEVAERIYPGDIVVVETASGSQEELTVVRRQILRASPQLVVSATTLAIPVGSVLKKKLGTTLTTWALYGTPTLTTEDWGWQKNIDAAGVNMDAMLPGMRVRAEFIFNGGAGLLWKENLTARVVSG